MSRNIKTIYPLSPGQEAMWLSWQITPDNVAYNIFISAKIHAYLNINVVNRVWQKIIEKYPILRTTYTSYDGKPVQQVNQQENFKVEVIDASDWREDQLAEKIYAIADRPFNLEKDSVLRVNLFTRSAEEHILLMTMHHIAGDMWSFDLLLREFQALYPREVEEVRQPQTEAAPNSLSENKTYANFVQWQAAMLSGTKGEKLWQYWQQQLAGELPILHLLPDKSRPPVKTYQGASYIVKLDEQLTEKLRYLASASNTSLYQILLTAFYVQLYRYTNQTDILIGSPMRGRTAKEFKEIVGYFSNLTLLRVSVEHNATFTELLAQVSKIVRQAQKNQDYPFSLLANKLQPQRDPSRSPLCQVSFTWQAQAWCEVKNNFLHLQKSVLPMEPYLLGQRGGHLDLSLMVREAKGVIEPCWQYNTDLFEAITIERMSKHFVRLLNSIVLNPQQPICQLSMLTKVEQHQLLFAWNNTQADYPLDKCIHQLFEEQVERTPDHIAVVFEGQQLNYRELNARANQLAHYLQKLGVGPDVLVGICVERSLEMIVGILGILKAGGGYLPLDPEYPTERLLYMLQDAQVRVLLTQKHLITGLPKHQSELVCLDTDWSFIPQAQKSNPCCEVQPENLAYAIYTSGSTGEPKGVMIQHSSVVNLAHGLHQAIYAHHQISPLRVSINGSLAFDTSVKQIIQLIYGHSLNIVPEKVRFDGHAMLSYLRQQKIDVLDCTPSQLRLLISVGLLDSDNHPQSVLVGGEAIDESMWATLAKAQNINFYNVYGPTECTVDSTICLITANLKPVIGRPIANVETYILDEYLQPVPVGVPGELHIGGAGLARGYLNHPQLTSEKFIPHPFHQERESRLYKTGDLARYLPDGNIEYLGRIDNQVKIRGFRIELGEIEAVLSQHNYVETTCVISREDSPGIKRLVAYIVPPKNFTSSTSELRQFLKARLPDYMIPSAFVTIEALPLTPNGKLDHRALPEPNLRGEIELSFVAPRSLEEEILATIWSQVLRVEPVGIYDNFFELGGDSILTIQIITRARKVGLELTPKQLFTHQSIAELATVAARITDSETEPEIVNPSRPEADTEDYTLKDFPLLQIDQIELEQILAKL